MFGMFDFFDMAGTYEERNVDNYSCEKFTVDTSLVTDNNPPYETAIKHQDFNYGGWITVEHYASKEDAQVGHDKWVNILKEDKVLAIQDDTPQSLDFPEIGFGREIYTKHK